jgi:hypothetical protein
MSLLLGCFEPATTAASMAICGPEAIDDAPGFGPERSGGWWRREFLASRGMPARPAGEESLTDAVASQAIEVPTVLRPDQAIERPCGPGVEQHPQEKTWPISSAAHKRSGVPGEGKETLAHRWDGVMIQPSVRTTALPMEMLSVGLEAMGDPERSNEGRDVLLTRTIRASMPRTPTRRR